MRSTGQTPRTSNFASCTNRAASSCTTAATSAPLVPIDACCLQGLGDGDWSEFVK